MRSLVEKEMPEERQLITTPVDYRWKYVEYKLRGNDLSSEEWELIQRFIKGNELDEGESFYAQQLLRKYGIVSLEFQGVYPYHPADKRGFIENPAYYMDEENPLLLPWEEYYGI